MLGQTTPTETPSHPITILVTHHRNDIQSKYLESEDRAHMATTRTGTRPWRRTRLTVIAASGGICALCGKPLTGRTHVDHIKPVAFGGTDDVTNLRATHPSCNMRRGVKPGDDDRPRSRVW